MQNLLDWLHPPEASGSSSAPHGAHRVATPQPQDLPALLMGEDTMMGIAQAATEMAGQAQQQQPMQLGFPFVPLSAEQQQQQHMQMHAYQPGLAVGIPTQQQPQYRTRARYDLRNVPIEDLERALMEDWVRRNYCVMY